MFDESHATLEGLRRAFGGQMSPAEAEAVAAHLFACRKCLLRTIRVIAAREAAGTFSVARPLQPVVDLYKMERARLEEWVEARAAWMEVRELSPKARRDKVRLSRALHTATFVQVLLEEGDTVAAPAESEEIFYLAFLAAVQLPGERYSVELKNDLCAAGCTEMANARRRQAKWDAAREVLERGLEYARKGTRNGVAEGKVLAVRGALEDDLGNGEEAKGILWSAAKLFEAVAETPLLSRTLAQLAYILVDPDPAESLRVVEQAVELIPPNNPRLMVFTEGIRMHALVNLGAPQEALFRLKEIQGLHEQFREPLIQIRRRFTEARILEHLKRFGRAESLLEEVIAGDLEHGFVKDFFLDLVYLLGFHLRRGQKEEAIEVCRRARTELANVVNEEGSSALAREQMLEVWLDLEDEVRKGTVDLGAPAVLRSYVKAHWRTPAAEAPSFRGR